MKLQMISENLIFKASFIAYIEGWRNEIPDDPEEDYFAAYKDLLDDYEGGLKKRLSWNNPEHLHIGKPFVQFYWLLNESDSIVGTIRYRTNVKEWMGNIGYEVSPKQRNRGYAKAMLRKLIDVLKKENRSNIKLTVSPINVPSIKVIENCGGKITGTTQRESNNKTLNEYEILI